MGDKKKGKKDGKQGGPSQEGPTGPQNCLGGDCKKKASRFGFCSEHYDQFKFGLITKEGKPVPDYEKKIDHYNAYKEKRDRRVSRAA